MCSEVIVFSCSYKYSEYRYDNNVDTTCKKNLPGEKLEVPVGAVPAVLAELVVVVDPPHGLGRGSVFSLPCWVFSAALRSLRKLASLTNLSNDTIYKIIRRVCICLSVSLFHESSCVADSQN